MYKQIFNDTLVKNAFKQNQTCLIFLYSLVTQHRENRLLDTPSTYQFEKFAGNEDIAGYLGNGH